MHCAVFFNIAVTIIFLIQQAVIEAAEAESDSDSDGDAGP